MNSRKLAKVVAMIGVLLLWAVGVSAENRTPLFKVQAVPAKPTVHQLISPAEQSTAAPSKYPQTVCQGNWQGSQSMAYLDWLTGLEAYFSYQDPTETGCTNTYPFGVVSIIWPIYVRQPTEIRLYPVLLEILADSLPCTYPGTPLFVGTDTLIQLNDTGFVTLEIPLPDTTCVAGPYFAAVVVDTFLNTGLVDIVVDSGSVPRTCASYNDFGHAPNDLITVSGFTDNLKLWSRGVNAPQSQCFCCTGSAGNVDCDLGGNVDISDLTRLIDYLYVSLSPLCCVGEANCDGQPGVDIADLSALIDYLYISFTPPASC